MIRAAGLTKLYAGLRAVDALSFEIGSGEIVGFLGPNGAGKSTTMRMLCGVLEPDEGQVWIDGLALRDDDPAPRARIGYLPEGTPLYRGMRVLDYLLFSAGAKGLSGAARRDALRRVLGQCGLVGHESRRIGVLSKGFRQRVGLAQALLADPPVLVLDEPTSGLDPAEVVRIRELVRELGERRTVLLSTHILSEAQGLCARVLILSGGKLVADGAPGALAAGRSSDLRLVLSCARERSAELELALRALEGVRACASEPARAGELAFALEVAEPLAAARAIGAWLAQRSIPVLELSHRAASLEDVFLARTGAPAAPRDAGGGSA